MSFPALLRCRRGRSYRHRGWFGLGVVLAAVALGGASPEAAAHYIAIDLHPSSGFIDSRAVGVSGGQQVGEGFGLVSEVGFNSSQALLWAGSAASVVNLHPRGFTFSIPGGVSGGQQVGRGRGPATGDRLHALLWAGSAESVIDLHPSGFFSSAGLRISGGQQVGIGNTARGEQHALLWAGSAASVVDLNPSGFNNSFAFGVSGGQQVGAGVGPATGFDIHALLWTGSAASVVDLHPSGFGESLVRDVSGSQQVGSGSVRPSNRSHALLWAGSAASAVDLNPSGFIASEAHGVSGGQQVGFGEVAGGPTHALLWAGSADSVIDLHTFLPLGFTTSQAFDIDADGNIVGVAIEPDGTSHAFLWKPVVAVPEPGTLALFGLGTLGLIGYAWRRRKQ